MGSPYLDAQVAFIAGLVAETLKATGARATKTHQYDVGKNLTFTPLDDQVAVVVKTNPTTGSISVHEHLITGTVVPGVTTVAEVLAGWALCGEAAALATPTGDAGTFPAGYTGSGGSIALYNAPTPPLVRGVYRSPLPSDPPDTRFPCLVVTRKGEQLEGTAPRRKRTVEIAIGLYLGKKTGDELEAAWGSLSARVGQIDGALVRGWHPGFESGAMLGDLCSCEDRQVENVTYGAALPDGSTDPEFPCVTLTTRVVQADDHPADGAALTRVVCKYGLDQLPDVDNEMVRRHADP